MKLEKAYLKSASTEEHIRNIDKLCRSAPPGDFMECGVLRGGTAAVIIAAAEGKRKIWLCDTFAGYPRPTEKDTNIDPKPYVPGFGTYTIATVRGRLESFGLDLANVKFIQGDFKDTLPAIMKEIEGLAFCNFDGDWYYSVMNAFPHILKKLVKGGILVIHDYPQFEGLVNAVHEFIPKNKLKKFTSRPGYSGVYYIKE